MKRILILCLLVLAGPSLAQDITMKLDQIGKGSYLKYSVNNQPSWHIFRGKTGKSHKTQVVFGEDVNGPLALTQWFDSTGNQLKWKSKAETVRFQPHNCQRTAGTCYFTRIMKNTRVKMVRVTKPTRKGFRFGVYLVGANNQHTKVHEGNVSIDHMGMATRSVVKSTETASKTYKSTQKRAFYK